MEFSGSTAIIIIIIENRLWCANLGDSRALIA
jgi:serine/threonine protein phosphatase PrpC